MAFGINRFYHFTSQMRAGGPEIPGGDPRSMGLASVTISGLGPHSFPAPPCGCWGTIWPRLMASVPMCGAHRGTPVTLKARSRPRQALLWRGGGFPDDTVFWVTPSAHSVSLEGRKRRWGLAGPSLHSSVPRATSSRHWLLSATWGWRSRRLSLVLRGGRHPEPSSFSQ